jgi:hypothetical protein
MAALGLRPAIAEFDIGGGSELRGLIHRSHRGHRLWCIGSRRSFTCGCELRYARLAVEGRVLGPAILFQEEGHADGRRYRQRSRHRVAIGPLLLEEIAMMLRRSPRPWGNLPGGRPPRSPRRPTPRSGGSRIISGGLPGDRSSPLRWWPPRFCWRAPPCRSSSSLRSICSWWLESRPSTGAGPG